MKPTPVLVVAGLLGSGKTSVVLSMLTAAGGLKRTKLGVIVNEFGALGIDGALIRRRAGGLIELTNGCVCCASNGELGLAVHRLLADYKLDCLIVELSGAADCYPVLHEFDTLRQIVLVRQVLTVLDTTLPAESLIEEAMLQHHIAAATLVVLNKTDVAPLQFHAQWSLLASGINRCAGQIATIHGRVPPDLAIAMLAQSTLPPDSIYHPPEPAAPRSEAGHQRMNSHTYTTTFPIDRSRVESLLRFLGPRLDRAKGFVRTGEQTELLNAVRGSWHFSAVTDDMEVPDETRLVFISRTISAVQLHELCDEYLAQ